LNFFSSATVFASLVFQRIERLKRLCGMQETNMEPLVNREVRQLCKAVAEEQEPMRVRQLLDQLLDILDERLLMASLF
jgi:hypothetical protein